LALACASGRQLLGARIFGGPLRVLYLSTEDKMDELNLRIRAAMLHHELTDPDVPGLHMIGAENWKLPLLHTLQGWPMLHQPGWNTLIAELNNIKPDVLIVDPLINTLGGVDASDNSAAALFMNAFIALAAERRLAVIIAHHTAKGRDPTSAESAMGAASYTNLARIALGIEFLDRRMPARSELRPGKPTYCFELSAPNRTTAHP
jgi:RecA-family ATPase